MLQNKKFSKQYIRKKALWLSKNGKIWCIGEYVVLQVLVLLFEWWYWNFFLTADPKIYPNASLICALCLLPALFLFCLNICVIGHYKSHVWPCLFIWIFFKPKIKDIKKAISDKRIRYEYQRVYTNGWDYYEKAAVEY